ncbi:MAG: hypothetical protein J6V08_04650 [Candidatus Methanomethylophilaceae archaeon]|nr:hypothetical protein [Candidatus Methanomethylophilaceae archaeon]
MNREELLDWCEEGTVILEGEEYDQAIVGISTDGKLVYDYDELVNVLMEDMTPEEAMDYLDYNTLRAIPYMGDKAPIIMRRIDWEVM